MSRNSTKQTVETFQEWHKWAKTQYPSYRVKKKPKSKPIWEVYAD
tara:strand:+ start:717 stop:851 length:135 start_codon:yes stop_codon:yes gene_type:complete